MQYSNLSIQTLFDNQLPDELAIPFLEEIKESCKRQNIKIVVLDDDPTGTQTVYNIPVITNWSEELITQTLNESSQGFFILTNTRSLPETEAVHINRQIAERLKNAAEKINCNIIVISRSDSTLRGHFPAEILALEEGWKNSYNGYILMPYFREGNRYTINNIHYLLEDRQLIPVSHTPFAKDAVFGYSSSDLTQYIEEKTSKRINHLQVKNISLEQLNAGITETENELSKLQKSQHVIVNATCAYHAAILALALVRQYEKGKRFLVRCSASLVQALFGINKLKILTAAALRNDNNSGGLIVAGSFVSKSTQQLEHLISNTDIIPVEADAEYLLNSESENYISRIAETIDKKLSECKSVLLYTSRKLITENNSASDLKIGNRISEAIVNIVKQIKNKPGFIIAKGGITSSDIATKSLNIQKAIVTGQLLPGIPVWLQGAEAKFPGMPYIIFPGNVGTADYMTMLYRKLTEQSN